MGSPGMSGVKTEPFTIYVVDGKATEIYAVEVHGGRHVRHDVGNGPRLAARRPGARPRHRSPGQVPLLQLRQREGRPLMRLFAEQRRQLPYDSAFNDGAAVDEIGRASCRERVCQYV